MRGAAKKTRRGFRPARAAVLLLAVLAVGLLASPASASLPRPPAVGGITGDPLAAAPAPAWPPLHTEPAEPSPAPEPARPRLRLFVSGSHGFGLFGRQRPAYDAGFLLETRLWAFELESGGLVGLGRLQVLESVGDLRLFATERRRGPRNRYYDPELGRFITADPLGYADGPSMYQFAGYDPVNRTDPTGLYCRECAMERSRKEKAEAERRRRWYNSQTFKGAVVLAQQLEGWGVGTNDAQVALSNYLLHRGVAFQDRIPLIHLLTGTGEGGVNDVLSELEGIGVWADFWESYLLNYPLAVTGGELAVAGRMLVSTIRQVGVRAAMRDMGAAFRPVAWDLEVTASGRGPAVGRNMVHLTDEAGKAGIEETKSIVGRHGIFAVPEHVSGEGTLMKVVRTGLTPSKTTQFVQIPEAGAPLFRQPLPVGPYSAWKYFGGVRYAPPGALSTTTGAFVPSNSFIGPRAPIYGPDVLFLWRASRKSLSWS